MFFELVLFSLQEQGHSQQEDTKKAVVGQAPEQEF